MKKLLTLSFILTCFSAIAQKNTDAIKLLISSRVDTTSSDVRAVIKLYESYYQSNPDSIYNNPFWNSTEKETYTDFDFSRQSIFQGGMDANTLFKYFTPFVLSVEPLGEKYQIRVLFSSNTTDPKYAGSKVWCIQKLNAVKENKNWVLENLLVELSKKWLHKSTDLIQYIYPPNHNFNSREAEKSNAFCKKVISRFNPSYNQTFKYYITSSIDDMGLLENFDYYFVGITKGKAREKMILSANGNEFYPHEFIHKLLPKNPKRSHLVEEGLATFLGTKEDVKEYKNLLEKLATDILLNPEKVNFESVISQALKFNGYQTAYPAGAALCELVYKIKGDNGLKILMAANTKNFDNLITTISSITGLNRLEIETQWKSIVFAYQEKE